MICPIPYTHIAQKGHILVLKCSLKLQCYGTHRTMGAVTEWREITFQTKSAREVEQRPWMGCHIHGLQPCVPQEALKAFCMSTGWSKSAVFLWFLFTKTTGVCSGKCLASVGAAMSAPNADFFQYETKKGWVSKGGFFSPTEKFEAWQACSKHKLTSRSWFRPWNFAAAATNK